MKQVLQDLNNGETYLEEVPCPALQPNSVLIRTEASLVSAGTERMMVEFGKGNLLQKARQQPDKVKQVLQKASTDGVMRTVDAVKNKLGKPIAPGYCNVGTVVESSCTEFKPGDRVASNGKHAEMVCVPKNLCAKIPDSVSDEEAAFTVIAAIALQGIRLIKPTLGETIVVTGLGLIGLVAVQLLRANGCKVIGLDYDSSKLAIAEELGAIPCDLGQQQDPIALANSRTRGKGVDAVLITASSTSNEPIHQAATMCRQRGRIVLVGVVGMEMSRADFYEKELSFQVSCSYGPGRYDASYEEQGQDYPYGLVRWTEQRNFEAVLGMLADGQLSFSELISHRFELAHVKDAYAEVAEGLPLGVMLTYPNDKETNIRKRSIALLDVKPSPELSGKQAVIGFIGAGSYTYDLLAPAFAASGARLHSIASVTGLSSVLVGKKTGIENATTDPQALLDNQEINAVVITTRHNSHAKWVKASLLAGKHVFVEKPLAITHEQLDDIINTYESLEEKPVLMVGFNRRYAPQIQTMKALLANKAEAKCINITVNADQLPPDHWTQDPDVGGGRIIGEACHFLDLQRFLVGHPITESNAVYMDANTNDTVMIQLKFADGSIGQVNYLANGHKSIPKERIEVFCGGGVLQLDNFRTLKAYGFPTKRRNVLFGQDKGRDQCAAAFISAVSASGHRSLPIAWDDLKEIGRLSIDLA